MPKRAVLYFLSILIFSVTGPAVAAAIEGLITHDEVRVRAKPLTSGKYAGILYKNMKVDVLEQTEEEMKIGEESHKWYRISTDEVMGWIYGKFLSFTIPADSKGTYHAAGDLHWYYKRFDEATWYGDSQFVNEIMGRYSLNAFDIGEYRELFVAAEARFPDAMYALYKLLVHMKENPDDLKYTYFHSRARSEKLLAAYLGESFRNPNIDIHAAFPEDFLASLFSDKAFYERHIGYVPQLAGLLEGKDFESDYIWIKDSLIKVAPYSFQFLHQAARNQAPIAEIAVKRNIWFAEFIDIEVAREIIDSVYKKYQRDKGNPYLAFQRLPEKFRNDKVIVRKGIEHDGEIFEKLPLELRKDLSLARTYLAETGAIDNIPAEMWRSETAVPGLIRSGLESGKVLPKNIYALIYKPLWGSHSFVTKLSNSLTRCRSIQEAYKNIEDQLREGFKLTISARSKCRVVK